MKTKRTELRVYQENAYCDCGGELIFNGSGMHVWPSKSTYAHNCRDCDDSQELKGVYPQIVYEELE